MDYDVFNGDADGICALHQLRLHQPAQRILITGVKRDIELLSRVPDAPGADVLVLDISLDANASALQRLLASGASVTWYDHHSADCAFQHPCLALHCDGAPDVCTSILVDRQLSGRYRPWAIAAAFGDNLEAPACALARSLGLHEEAVAALAQLGHTLNYNAYGECEGDLHMAPSALYRVMSGYDDPFDFMVTPTYKKLHAGYRSDCAQLQGLMPYFERPGSAVYLLPATPWSRRISGVLANRLASERDGRSFAVINERSDGDFLVSVRSSRPEARSACGLCQQFDSGGGRKAAAGINRLPAADLSRFIERFSAYFAPFAA